MIWNYSKDGEDDAHSRSPAHKDSGSCLFGEENSYQSVQLKHRESNLSANCQFPGEPARKDIYQYAMILEDLLRVGSVLIHMLTISVKDEMKAAIAPGQTQRSNITHRDVRLFAYRHRPTKCASCGSESSNEQL